MSKPRAHKVARWDVRCADVLAGKTKLDAISLIALINEVNPTGRDRDSKETVERYALKARLESLLVKAHPQSLEVVRDPENDVIVSIRSRLQPQSACHAAIDTLDDEARSWVLREIDVAAWDSAHSGVGMRTSEARRARSASRVWTSTTAARHRRPIPTRCSKQPSMRRPSTTMSAPLTFIVSQSARELTSAPPSRRCAF